jgi:endonuclease/exonuclease/phosphatase family metal-dependent hydrolase
MQFKTELFLMLIQGFQLRSPAPSWAGRLANMKRIQKRMLNWWILPWIAMLGLFSGCRTSPPERMTSPQSFRVMTFNIHHGEGLDGKVDFSRIATLIQRERADLVALQEVDKGVLRTARRDLPAELAALTGLTCVFSNNFHYQGGEYGNAVLTRFPALSATNSHYQMLHTNEQRGILQLTLDVYGRRLTFMNTHIDYRRDDSERLLNVREIGELMTQSGRHDVILCGDFNAMPDSQVYQRLKTMFNDTWESAGKGTGWTYPADNPRRRIDYIWISKTTQLEAVNAYVSESAASDHRPLVVEMRFK